MRGAVFALALAIILDIFWFWIPMPISQIQSPLYFWLVFLGSAATILFISRGIFRNPYDQGPWKGWMILIVVMVILVNIRSGPYSDLWAAVFGGAVTGFGVGSAIFIATKNRRENHVVKHRNTKPSNT